MAFNKAIDLDLYGRGFDGIFGDGSEFDIKRHALRKQKAMEDFKVHVKPGMHIDYDLYGRDDPRVFETTEEAAADQEPLLNTERTRVRRLSARSFLVPVKILKKKVGAFVRKLSGSSARNRSDGDSRRSASVQSVTPVTVREENLNDIDGVPVSDGEAGVPSLRPISDVRHEVEEGVLQDEEKTSAPTLLHESNLVTIVESAVEVTESDAEEPAYDDRVDNAPRRVRSKLPSEEERPYIEPGMVAKVIAKLNSANSVEFRQASSFVKKTSLLPLTPNNARAVTMINSSADGTESGSSETVSDAISLTQSSVASEAKESSGKSVIFDVSPSGRVERLRSLFQEEDSPSLFQYGMGSSYAATQAPRSGMGNNKELNGAAQQPAISSPRDLFSGLADHNQNSFTPNVEGLNTRSVDSKRVSVEEVADAAAVGAPLFVDQSKSRGESVSSSEETALPLVPRGLSCDSQADLDDGGKLEEPTRRELCDVSGGNAYVQQHENKGTHASSGSVQESGSGVEPLAENGIVENSLRTEGSQDSRTTSAKSAEPWAANLEGDNAPASASMGSTNAVVTVSSGEDKESQNAIDGDKSGAEAETSSQESSDVPVGASNNRITLIDATPLLWSNMFDEYVETD
ncbi:hypothetical protein BWQ96_04837 [Gracilariopsis chorda]|uniref:Uncharacterized protein n=1 Tax=Gracilariopsis chorda TaxID=448386 RepID=A0A2V3ITJ7_9FLOR|nr:hypothetical protein BWQ96_04837 [Gracilariopsis chorda]|eukprot:PXF45422.1 hypothetical protein BWQ96_04837 [Gracilariopsis chorda]